MTTIIKTLWQTDTGTGTGEWQPLPCECKYTSSRENGRIYVIPCDTHHDEHSGEIDLPNILDAINVNGTPINPMDTWTIGQDNEPTPERDEGA